MEPNMLPPDFSWDHVTPTGVRSVNATGRWGDHFVKHVDPPDHIIEPAVSRIFTAAAVPHLPVTYHHRTGNHLLTSPWHDGKPLVTVTQDDINKINTHRALHLLTTEWLAHVEDRHAGNYLTHPQHGVIPIDFGHSLTSTGTLKTLDGALMALLRRHKGVVPSTPLHPASVAHLRRVAEEIRAHFHTGTSGFEEKDRDLARAMFEERLKHFLSEPKPTLEHLLKYRRFF